MLGYIMTHAPSLQHIQPLTSDLCASNLHLDGANCSTGVGQTSGRDSKTDTYSVITIRFQTNFGAIYGPPITSISYGPASAHCGSLVMAKSTALIPQHAPKPDARRLTENCERFIRYAEICAIVIVTSFIPPSKNT